MAGEPERSSLRVPRAGLLWGVTVGVWLEEGEWGYGGGGGWETS